MKKTLFFLLLFLFLALPFAQPPQTLAACDELKYDKNRAFEAAQCPDTSCDTGIINRELGNIHVCWPYGATSKQPECPPGYVSPPACYGQNICCTGSSIANLNTCDFAPEKSGSLWPCDDIKKNSITSPANYCPSDTLYDYTLQGGACLASQKSGVYLCLSGSCDTAIGAIDVSSPTGLIESLYKFITGITGGIVVIMMIIAGYQILTSAGDPQKLAAAKELIVSLISGIILIIFSLVLLQAIGVDILHLPGLS